jgi:long-chain acyl-CoA synthetase
VALIVPDFVALRELLPDASLPEAPQKVVERDDVYAYIHQRVTSALKAKLGGYEVPKKVILIPEDFTVENGMLTQTMKLKRRNVFAAYRNRIEAAYRD